MTRSDRPITSWLGHDAEFWREQWHAGTVRLFSAVGSTNDVVAQLANAGASNLAIAVADEQTRGRGRGGASWQAPSGAALLFSVLFRTTGHGAAPGCAPIRIGLAVCAALEQLTGTRPGLKWPNDIVLDGNGKVAGILCEGVFGQRGSAHIVAGIGINVSQSAADLAPELRGRACSVFSATGISVDRATLLTSIMQRFHQVAQRITDPLQASELASYQARDVLRGHEVVCDLQGERMTGVARGLGEDGALLIEQADGVRAVYNGTVRLAQTHAYPGGTQ